MKVNTIPHSYNEALQTQCFKPNFGTKTCVTNVNESTNTFDGNHTQSEDYMLSQILMNLRSNFLSYKTVPPLLEVVSHTMRSNTQEEEKELEGNYEFNASHLNLSS